MKIKSKNKKDMIRAIIGVLISLIFLAKGFYNVNIFSRLERFGIRQKAVVDFFNVKSWSSGRGGGRSYDVNIKYHLYDNTEQGECVFHHKPVGNYAENDLFYMLYDVEGNFKIPEIELEAAKRNMITGNFIYAAISLFASLLPYLLGYMYKKSYIKHKTRKKRWKHKPELKEKEKKIEKLHTLLIFIIISPFVLIQIIYNRICGKKKKK